MQVQMLIDPLNNNALALEGIGIIINGSIQNCSTTMAEDASETDENIICDATAIEDTNIQSRLCQMYIIMPCLILSF